METQLLFLLFIVSLTSIFWYIRRKTKEDQTPKNNTNYDDNLSEYTAFQEVNSPKLTPKERLNLSWEPIRKIGEYVLKFFSANDKNKLVQLGEKLVKYGMEYIHVIDYTIPKKKYSKTNEYNKDHENSKNQISR